MGKLLLSACPAGEQVRYDGENEFFNSPILVRWINTKRLIPFCPEIAGSLGVPRPPAEIQNGSGEDVLLKKQR